MRAAQIINGVVASFIEVEEFTEAWVSPEGAQIGDTWDGHEFSHAPAPIPAPVVPASVSMLSARRVLISTGLIAGANAYLAGLIGMDGDLARADWEFSPRVHRNNPLVIDLGSVLGKTPGELDALFIAADALDQAAQANLRAA